MIINDYNDTENKQYRPKEKSPTDYITYVSRPGGVNARKICCLYCGKRIFDTEREIHTIVDGMVEETQGKAVDIKCSYCGVKVRIL